MKALTLTLIVATLVQTALSGPVPTTPQASKVPKTVDEILDMYINEYYYSYDYRVDALNAEIDQILPYIRQAKAKATDDDRQFVYNYIEHTIIQFQKKMNQLHHVIGINDVLMFLGAGIPYAITHSGDDELVQKSQVLIELLKMDEFEKQAQAMKKLSEFLKASDESVNKEYDDKFEKWRQEHFSGVSILE